MANYLVTDTELTSVADAIREKGGTTGDLEFPSDFISAIAAISGGGGGSSNVLVGEFHTQTVESGDTAMKQEYQIVNYSGTGYPLAILLWVKGGIQNDSSETWNTIKRRYAMGVLGAIKNKPSVAPVYGTAESVENSGALFYVYKNSTTSATQYASAVKSSSPVFNRSAISTSYEEYLKYAVQGTSHYFMYGVVGSSGSYYGLLHNTDYKYAIIYSE